MISFNEKYKIRIKVLRMIAEDILKIIAIVTAISFLDYFQSSADLQYGTKYLTHYYDRPLIMSNLIKHNLLISAKTITELKPKYAKVMDHQYFDRNNPINPNDSKYYEYYPGSLDDFKKGLQFRPAEKAANYFTIMQPWVGNESFWEGDELIDIFDSLLDTVSFYNTMKIILAGREVVTQFHISNDGELPAKNIKIYLRAPFMLWPRELITNARVEYLRIEPDYPDYEYLNNKTTAIISIPFLKKGDKQDFWLHTSLHNITDWNIFVDFETDKRINPIRIFYIFLGVSLLYYFAPLLLVCFIGKKNEKHEKTNDDSS